jgi:hypothetical protein
MCGYGTLFLAEHNPALLRAVAHFAAGRHTRTFWNSITPQAFDFVGRLLGDAGPSTGPSSAHV